MFTTDLQNEFYYDRIKIYNKIFGRVAAMKNMHKQTKWNKNFVGDNNGEILTF